METLDSPLRPPDAAARPRSGTRRKEGVTIGGVAAMGFNQGSAERRIYLRLGLHPLDPARAFQAADPGDGERTGEPVASGKRCPVLQQRRNRHHHRESEVTAGHDSHLGAQRAADLNFDDRCVVP
jgi:hypothetical protein